MRDATRGVTGRPRLAAARRGEIYAHPYNPNMVAMLARRRDCAGAGQPEQKCPHTLLVHENFGHDDTQWRDLVALSDERIFGFLQFEWGALTVQHASDPSQLAQNRRILATVIVRKADKAAGSKLDPDEIQFVASDNYFDDPHELLLPCVTQFVVVDDNIAVAVPAQCAPDDAAALDKHHKHPIEPGAAVRNLVLFVSEDEGRTFQEACIPSMDMDMMFALYDLEGLGGTYAGLMLVTGEGWGGWVGWVGSAGGMGVVECRGDGGSAGQVGVVQGGSVDAVRVGWG